jgi:hypothetical protein
MVAAQKLRTDIPDDSRDRRRDLLAAARGEDDLTRGGDSEHGVTGDVRIRAMTTETFEAGDRRESWIE